MNRLLGMVPMLVIAAYMTIENVTHFRIEIMRPVASVLALVLLGAVYVLNRKDAASAIEKSFCVFVCSAAVVFWFLPDTLGRLLATFSAAVLFTVLLLAAAVPPLAGKEPFTTHFARKVAPEAVWETDIFIRINLNLTWMWTAIFGLCVASALVPQLVAGAAGAVPTILFEAVLPLALILGLGLTLSKYYPGHYQRKMGMVPAAAVRNETAPVHEEESRSTKLPVQEDTAMDKPKVVAVNGSPHVAFGNTGLMIEMLREPLAQEGLDLEVIHLSELHIEYCIGCALCLEKGSCWRRDDFKPAMSKLMEADAVILGSPVYIYSVTGQMKTFLDRSVSGGHRPSGSWKPGLVISVSTGYGETAVGEYLGRILRLYGAFPVGRFTAIAVGPGEFLGKDAVEQRARDLARDLATAVKEERRYPATDQDFEFWAFMGWLIRENQGFMQADHKHWEKVGLYDGFEGYAGQERASGVQDPEMRKAWIKSHIDRQREQRKESTAPAVQRGPQSARSARELLEMMPLGLNKNEAAGLSAVYQFEIGGDEDFTAHLVIADQKATFHEGPAENPNVTVISPPDIWLQISRGELDGAQAFMSGKYKVKGEVSLLMRLKALFSG